MSSASIFKTDRHKGTVRGLAWNTLQPSLFASGATDAEVCTLFGAKLNETLVAECQTCSENFSDIYLEHRQSF